MPVAVVTGGSSGIGLALARLLAERDWQLVLVARSEERLRRAADELGAEAESCDVAERPAVEELARRVGERHGRLDLLVNNAGVPAGGRFLELAPEQIEQVLRINYLGGVWCLRAFLPLLEAARPSQVVNVASVAGFVPYGPSGPYAASKSAQLAFSRSVGVELAPRGVHVLTVNPGFVETPGFPQRHLLRYSGGGTVVARPERVARAIVKALDAGAPEIFVPRPWRAVALLQALAPSTLWRVLAERERRRA